MWLLCEVINISWDLKVSRPWIYKLLHCGVWCRVFWYFATSVLKKNVEGAGCRFFQTSGTLLQIFQRKILKIKRADSSKILVHFYKCFEEKCWRYRKQILPKFWYIFTKVSKEIAEDTSRIFFQNSGSLLQMFQSKMLKIQAGDPSKILVHSYQCFRENIWIRRQQILPKFWYACTALCDFISLEITVIFTTG
jgi:uncharacterized protein YggT (Ycf19 family)